MKLIGYIHGFQSRSYIRYNQLNMAYPLDEVQNLKSVRPSVDKLAFERRVRLNIQKLNPTSTHIVGHGIGALWCLYLNIVLKDLDNVYYYPINPILDPYTKLNETGVKGLSLNRMDQFKYLDPTSVSEYSEITDILHTESNPERLSRNTHFFIGTKDAQEDHYELLQYLERNTIPFTLERQAHNFKKLNSIIKSISEKN